MPPSDEIEGNSDLQTSIYLLNNLCADIQFFSYSQLAALKLRSLTFRVDALSKVLTMIVSSDGDYYTLSQYLFPGRRLYELLGIHFTTVQVAFGTQGESADNAVLLKTISLKQNHKPADIRDTNALGARLRRALSIAMQGHIGVLRLRDEREVKQLRTLWERSRVTQLVERY
ncbi:MAG: hypothetical protein BWK79_17330, partial [Beggiatoa sp. IS2]